MFSPTKEIAHTDFKNSAADMNWTALVWGAPMLMAIVWWLVDARKWFKGPKVSCEDSIHGKCNECQPNRFQVNVEHQMFGRGSNVIEGQGKDSGDDSSRSDMKDDVDKTTTRP